MQFGDVEEAGREVQLRPDQNRHYAVVAVHKPEDVDIPIYVDIDVMRDMESHALTDTSVELGGVMLGGQYEDEDGNPFVVVTDSLRAEHYEATKGSFKFTHETWQKISRQREEFPEDLQMVGWYHTHPDWGVFLSGMDMFICDNFFNRPLDLALVIDPCRGDRGWFHWVEDSNERIRRTGGFYLIGSRFRKSELDYFAFQLQGKLDMAADYRGAGIAGSISPGGSPVVNIHESKDSTMNHGILGLLAVQFLFLAMISWKMLFGGTTEDEIKELRNEIVAMSKEKTDAQKVKILERALTLSGDKDQLADLLVEKDDLQIQLEDSKAKRLALTSTNKSLTGKNKRLEADNGTLKNKYNKSRKKVTELEADLKAAKESGEGGDATPWWKNSTVILFVVALGFVCCVAGGVVGFLLGRVRPEDDFEEEESKPFEIRAVGEDDGKDSDESNESEKEAGNSEE